MMVHDLWSECSDRLFDTGLITKVDPVHLGRRVDVGFVAGAEVVENGDHVARCEVRVDDVGTDETGLRPSPESALQLTLAGLLDCDA